MRDKVSSARQWTGNGLSALGRGAAREAKSCFARASNELPNDSRIVANLARAHYQQGEFQQATQVMTRAVELAGGADEMEVELGEYHLRIGQADVAMQLADQVLKANHKSTGAWLLRGRSRGVGGDWSGALSDYQRALGIANMESEQEEIQLEIVEAYRRLNQPLRALSAVEQVLHKYPVDRHPESALLAKSEALVQLKQLDPAIEILQVAAKRKDISSAAWTMLADVQVRAGRLDQARRTLASAQEKYPGDSRVATFVSELGSQEPRVALSESTTSVDLAVDYLRMKKLSNSAVAFRSSMSTSAMRDFNCCLI